MAGKKYYLDSSALVKGYVEEDGTDAVDSLFGEAERGDAKVCLSVWNVGECAGVFDKYARKGLSNAKDAMSLLLGELKRLGRSGSAELVPVSRSVISMSTNLVFKHHVHVADALQLASSAAASCTHFVTADKSLCDVAKRELSEVIRIA